MIMAEYGKIKTDGSIQSQGNPVSVTIANPDEEQKRKMADLRGELELRYTNPPEYDQETQYLTESWVQEGQYAVQVWEVHDIEPDDSTESDTK